MILEKKCAIKKLFSVLRRKKEPSHDSSRSCLFKCHQHLTVLYCTRQACQQKMLPANIWLIGHCNTMTSTMKMSNGMNVFMNTVINNISPVQ